VLHGTTSEHSVELTFIDVISKCSGAMLTCISAVPPEVRRPLVTLSEGLGVEDRSVKVVEIRVRPP